MGVPPHISGNPADALEKMGKRKARGCSRRLGVDELRWHLVEAIRR